MRKRLRIANEKKGSSSSSNAGWLKKMLGYGRRCGLFFVISVEGAGAVAKKCRKLVYIFLLNNCLTKRSFILEFLRKNKGCVQKK